MIHIAHVVIFVCSQYVLLPLCSLALGICIGFFVFYRAFCPHIARMNFGLHNLQTPLPISVWEVHSRFFYLSKSHTAMEINNERWFSERMNNNPKRHSRGKRNAKMKQQILRKENRKQAKYPQRPEYRQNVFLKQARKRGA